MEGGSGVASVPAHQRSCGLRCNKHDSGKSLKGGKDQTYKKSAEIIEAQAYGRLKKRREEVWISNWFRRDEEMDEPLAAIPPQSLAEVAAEYEVLR